MKGALTRQPPPLETPLKGASTIGFLLKVSVGGPCLFRDGKTRQALKALSSSGDWSQARAVVLRIKLLADSAQCSSGSLAFEGRLRLVATTYKVCILSFELN